MEEKLDKDINVRSKLTDEEIVKVLDECFAKVGEMSCKDCSVYTGNGLRACMKSVGINALNLIHRLQADNQKQYEDYCLLEVENLNLRQENENLRIDNDDLRERNENLYEIGLNENTARFEDMKKIEWLEDEAQRLAKVVMDLIGKIAEQKAEIERLTEENGYLKQCADTFLADYKKAQSQVDELTAKLQCPTDITEAVKPFVSQAVKDTAKEILNDLSEYYFDALDNTDCAARFDFWCRKYGVEVE